MRAERRRGTADEEEAALRREENMIFNVGWRFKKPWIWEFKDD